MADDQDGMRRVRPANRVQDGLGGGVGGQIRMHLKRAGQSFGCLEGASGRADQNERVLRQSQVQPFRHARGLAASPCGEFSGHVW